VSARIGRIGRRLDGNVQFDRPVDANRIDPSGPGRKKRVARACAVAGAIACGFIAPATARAADPFGAGQLAQEVDAAVAQATAAASQASGAAGVGVVSPESTKTLADATKSLEVATTQAAAVASSAATQAEQETQQPAAASVPSGASPEPAHARVSPKRRAAVHRPRRAARSTPLRSALRTAVVSHTEGKIPSLPTPSRRATIADGRGQTGGTRTSRGAPEPARWPPPRRSPPLPPLPQPGAALSAQGGGHGPVMPLVLGALAAMLLAALFEFLPRTLPLPAFRKPRQIALAPWHPG
jgi:hypothetical protein